MRLFLGAIVWHVPKTAAMVPSTRPGVMRAQHARRLPRPSPRRCNSSPGRSAALALGSPQSLSAGGLVLTHAKTPSRPLSTHVSTYPSAPALAMRAPSYPDPSVPTLLPQPSMLSLCARHSSPALASTIPPPPPVTWPPDASHNQKQREAERSERP